MQQIETLISRSRYLWVPMWVAILIVVWWLVGSPPLAHGGEPRYAVSSNLPRFEVESAFPAAPVKAAPNYDAAGACVRVAWRNFGGSGVCVASENGKSLVVSCNHIFTEARQANGEFARAAYPLACSVTRVDGGAPVTATAVDGDTDCDLAFLVVDGELPVAAVAPTDAPAGTQVWHRGIGSGGGRGRVLAWPRHDQPKHCFASSASSDSGDSGAGLFDPEGRVVAVNCGKHDATTERGTPVSAIRRLLKGVTRGRFEALHNDLGDVPDVPQTQSPVYRSSGAVG